jgi:hypothetical protein
LYSFARKIVHIVNQLIFLYLLLSLIKSDLISHMRINQTSIPHKVDINILLSNVRKKEKAKKKESVVFLSLIGSVVVISGIIASF